MTRVPGGVTAPEGYLASGVAAGIKRRGKDVALIFSQPPADCAGLLTVNRMKASSIHWAEGILRRGKARLIVANSGNANCCTGQRGSGNTTWMARWAAQQVGIKPQETFVASTGVIGRFLPKERLKKGIAAAAQHLNRRGSLSAAEAIMTTDTRPKEMALRFWVAGIPVTVGGIAKGSGMVSPHMATMLAFLTTDARVERSALRNAVKEAAAESFNRITVDGEMSTNDMVLLLANGASLAPTIRKSDRSYRDFSRALQRVCSHLAHEIVKDGEGVTRLMTVRVTGAKDRSSASCVARRVGESLLVKTMVAGRDPNWGRIAAAVGGAGVPIDPKRLTIRLGSHVVFRNGEPAHPNRKTLLTEVDRSQVQIGIDLGLGKAEAQILSSDLTEGYIRINAKYTT